MMILKFYSFWRITVEGASCHPFQMGLVMPRAQGSLVLQVPGMGRNPLQHCALVEKALTCPAPQSPSSDMSFAPLPLG